MAYKPLGFHVTILISAQVESFKVQTLSTCTPIRHKVIAFLVETSKTRSAVGHQDIIRTLSANNFSLKNPNDSLISKIECKKKKE